MPDKFMTIVANIVTMVTTTIQVSQDLVQVLKGRKLYDKESYEEVIWDLVEDTMSLSEETMTLLKQAEKDIKEGRVFTHEEVKAELGL